MKNATLFVIVSLIGAFASPPVLATSYERTYCSVFMSNIYWEIGADYAAFGKVYSRPTKEGRDKYLSDIPPEELEKTLATVQGQGAVHTLMMERCMSDPAVVAARTEYESNQQQADTFLKKFSTKYNKRGNSNE